MSAEPAVQRKSPPMLAAVPPPAPRSRGLLRFAVATFAFVLLVLAGAVYPFVARGNELLSARWAEPWALAGLVLVPLVLWRAVLGEDRRTPRLRLGTLSVLGMGPAGPRVYLRDVPGIARAIGLALCIAALARPMNSLRSVSTDEEGIDILVALDMSGSMRAVLDNVPEDLSTYLPR